MTQAYDVGDKPRFSAIFANYADADADPLAVSFKCLEPDGILKTYTYGDDAELVKDATGKYHVDYAITKSGRHQIKFIGVGGVDSVQKSDFYTRR